MRNYFMNFKPLFYTLFKSLNPYNYKELIENKFSQIIKYCFFILFFAIFLTFILLIPAIYSTNEYISQGTSHFDNIILRSDVSVKDSFNILNTPLIRFENNTNNITDEFLLITPETISYKSYLFFGSQKDITLKQDVDLASNERAKKAIGLIFFFMLPSLLFWSIIFSMIYFTIIIFLTLIVMLMISGILRINIGISRLLKVCMYSSTVLILLQLLLMPFFKVFALPLAIYWILILVVLFVLRDNFEDNKNRRSNYNSDNKESKTKSIFGQNKSSSNSRKINTPIQDSYDVDANGNIKGSSKKSRKYSDDDDGYVELK